MRFRPLRLEPTPAGTIAAPSPELPATMRAAVLESASATSLRSADVGVPTPVLSEVLVRVVAAGVNQIDAKTARGAGLSEATAHYPATLGSDFRGVAVPAPFAAFPFPPGTEVSGIPASP